MSKNIKTAFTLVELLVVIAIVGILSGLIIVGMSSSVNSARIAKAQIFSASLRDSLLNSLISEWKFDELPAGFYTGTVKDTWGTNDGTYDAGAGDTNDKTASGSNCIYGKCLSFDGTNDYAYVSGSDAASSNLAITGAITLSTWVKFNTAGTYQAFMGRGNTWMGAGNWGYSLTRLDTNRIIFGTCNTTICSELVGNISITDANWHLITATWDGTTNTNGKKLYIDGALDNQITSTISAMGQPAYQFRIGTRGAGGGFLNGLMDDARVYNNAIPLSEIREWYYSGLNRLYSSGKINFNEYINRINKLT